MTDPVFLQPPNVTQLATPPVDGATPRSTEDQMLELAREFESTLILQMLRQMQQSVLSEEKDTGLGSGPLGDTLHQEVARQLSQVGGFGLSEGLAQAIGRQNGPGATGAGIGAVDFGPLPSANPDVVNQALGGAAPGHSAVPLPLGGADVTSQFGWRADPFNGQSKFHGGVDIRAAEGDTVPAAKDGLVVSAGEQGGYGTTVVIEHEGGVRTRYAHLSGLDVAAGDRVSAGQSVGQVGQTGRATGPHLHFEVLREGQRLDPILAARRFSEALKKVEQVADLNDGGSEGGPRIALE